MKIDIRCWERKENFDPDYTKPVYDTINGRNAYECMAKYGAMMMDHDVMKFTCLEIIYVYD